MACIGDCPDIGPPPDMILSMPPPPLPAFLLPRNAVVNTTPPDTQPCFAAFMCEPSPGPREQTGIEFIELSRKGMEDTWLFVLISSCVGVLLLGALLAMLIMKCRESYNFTYADSNMKQPPLASLGEPHITAGSSKSNGFMAGTLLYPCATTNYNNDNLQQQLSNDSRVLWAALTPSGTQHFVSYPAQEDHYEVVDYTRKQDGNTIKNMHFKNSFENSGFVDYDYEDPTPLMESYHMDDMDSGYQEPQEIISTFQRNSTTGTTRTLVSSPTRIENPNIAPLNMYPHRGTLPHNGTLNSKKAGTLSRRISDMSSTNSTQVM